MMHSDPSLGLVDGEKYLNLTYVFAAEVIDIDGKPHVQVRDPNQPTFEQRRVCMSFERAELEEMLSMLEAIR